MPKMLRMILRVLLLISFTCCVCGAFDVNVTQSSYQAEENQNITLEWTFTTTADTSPNDINVSCLMFSNNMMGVVFYLRGGVEDSESQDKHFAGRVQCDKDDIRKGRIRLHVSRLKTEDSGQYVCQVSTSSGEFAAACHLDVSARAQPEPETLNTVRDQPEPETLNTVRDQPEPETLNTVRDQPEPETLNTARAQPEPETLNTVRDQPEPETLNTVRDQPEPETLNTASQGRIALYWSLGLTAAALLSVCCL